MLSSTCHMVPHIHLAECPKIYIFMCDRPVLTYVRIKIVRIDPHSKSCANALGNKATVIAGTVFNQSNPNYQWVNLHDIIQLIDMTEKCHLLIALSHIQQCSVSNMEMLSRCVMQKFTGLLHLCISQIKCEDVVLGMHETAIFWKPTLWYD